MKDEYEGLAQFQEHQSGNKPVEALQLRFVPSAQAITPKQVGGKYKYNESEEHYPRLLWAGLMECIKDKML